MAIDRRRFLALAGALGLAPGAALAALPEGDTFEDNPALRDWAAAQAEH